MNPRIWKWINRIFLSGIWVQPFAMAGLIWFFKNVLQGDVSYLILFVLSFLPSIYIWLENQREQAAGKMDFSIEDTFHDRPTEYSSPLKMQAMYPRVNERFLFDYPEGVVFGRTETGMVKKHTEYLCKPLEKEHYRDGHVLLIGGSGSGKSASVIIPTLLASPDNMGMFIVDIKGELWRKSRRVDDKNTVIIDFQDRSKYGWDGLYMLNSKVEIRDKDVRECMEMIANSLIPISAKDSNEFWKQSGRSLLTGELIGLWKDGETKNLSELINIILSRDTRELVEELMDKAKPNASETKFLSSFKNLADETLSGVVQQMQESVKVFVDDDIRYAFESNTKRAHPLMIEDGKAIFLAVREEKLEAYYNVINLIIAQVFDSLIKRPEGSLPVMVVIDEMARLCSRGAIYGLHNQILLTGRSRNITLIMVTQSYEALSGAYSKDDIQSIVANSAYVVVLDCKSPETAKSICSMVGNYKEREKTWSGTGKNRSVSISYRDKPILEPSDLSKLVVADEAIIVSAEFGYCRVKKCFYFNDAVLGELSGKVQTYNQEALGIEGKNTVQMPVYSVDAEESDKNWMDILNDILKQCGGFLKKKFMYIVEQYKTGEKKDEKRRNR